MIVEEEVMNALRSCYDPCCREREISVVDMGLIENIRIKGDSVDIDMVLTTGWCPFVATLYSTMEEQVKLQCQNVKKVNIKVLWDPAWSKDRLSESARKKLDFPLDELIPYREKRISEQKKIIAQG